LGGFVCHFCVFFLKFFFFEFTAKACMIFRVLYQRAWISTALPSLAVIALPRP
jgi:hypothetical protein